MSGRSGERMVDLSRLDGGVNLWEVQERLGLNESGEMENLWWAEGALQSREGQEYITGEIEGGVAYAATQEPFWDRTFLHISGKLWCLDHTADRGENRYDALEEVYAGVPRDRGSFFRYGEHLYYKNRGGFYQIAYTPEGERLFTVRKVEDLAYTPTILLNADPATGSGDLYQPENRLSGRKRVKYNAALRAEQVVKTGDGTSRIFSLSVTEDEGLAGVEEVYFGASLVSKAVYEVNVTLGTVTFAVAPEEGVEITFVLDYAVADYKLPVGDVETVEEVRVNGTLLSEGEDYAVDLVYGKVSFVKAPEVTDPPVNNTVEIVYRKENSEAKESILSCRYGGVYGGGVQVCMVLGGCEAQPNAIFWNSNDDVFMNPAYWPMPFYNLCGDAQDSVTGFGRQYTELIVFKEKSIGKAEYGIEGVNGRDSISLTYQRVNDKIGCDLPGSIQLIENNLVFANSAQGVFRLLSASAAYENNVALLSRNVNGCEERPGLLHDLRVTSGAGVGSLDDGERYWLSVNGHAYVWDYLLSSASKPSWFYFTNIPGQHWWSHGGKRYHMDAHGRLSRMGRIYHDYDGPIRKVYQFPVLHFGTYDRLKDVTGVIFSLRGGKEGNISITYRTDWEVRQDLTPIRTSGAGLVPRDLSKRDLGVETFAVTARRRPGCRRVRHFTMRLENNGAGEDLCLLSAQVIYRLLGRDR